MVSQWTRESNSKFDICRRGILRPESRRRGGGLVRFPAANASIATKSPLKPRRSPQNDALSPPTSSPQSHRNYTTDGAKHPSSTICGALSAIMDEMGLAGIVDLVSVCRQLATNPDVLSIYQSGIYFIPFDDMQESFANDAQSTRQSTAI
jgi:hypothetical protein